MLLTSKLLAIQDMQISPGDRWIYVAGFNVDCSLKDTQRIDCEIDDLEYLSSKGAKVAVLSHQGSNKQQTSKHLDYVAAYLSRKMRSAVCYFPENSTTNALQRAAEMKNGEIVIFGNTRFHSGEEKDDLELARFFAKFGSYVAAGGFSKAHRAHASNNSLFTLLPTVVAKNVVAEIDFLNRLMIIEQKKSAVAIIGGVKIEKITKGLAFFKNNYQHIILTGTILNNYLALKKIDIGLSCLGDAPQVARAALENILDSQLEEKILLPQQIVIAKLAAGKFIDKKIISLKDTIPKDYAIVDIDLEFPLNKLNTTATAKKNHVVVAGTPCMVKQGFTAATGAIKNFVSQTNSDCYIMGGDTIEDMQLSVPCSVGGGAALHYLHEKNLPMLASIAASQLRFKNVII